MKFSKVLLTTVLLCSVAFTGCSAGSENTEIHSGDTIPQQGHLIQDFYPDKSAYRPGEKTALTVDLKNETGKNFSGKIAYSCKYLGKSVFSGSADAALKNGEAKKLSFSWTPPKDDYRGYLVEAAAVSDNTIQDHRNTAVDVSSDWKRYPRYGYLCEYQKMTQREIDKNVENLSRYHINGLQFYDWQDCHDTPLAGTPEKPSEKWQDIAGRDTYAATVSGYISALHKKNMIASNYNLMYGAYDGFEKRGVKKEWALYTDEKRGSICSYSLPDNWESSLNLMNPANAGWRSFILGQEKKVFQAYPFDVYHIDTLGSQGSVYDFSGRELKLDKTYPQFLKDVKSTLNKGFVLNTVNECGIKEAGASDADFLYTEAWPSNYPDYASLQRVVYDNFKASNNKKAVTVAAYLNYGLQGGEFNPNAVKLADAALFASGASHLELGDTGMLSSEYFPNRKVSISASLAADLRSYYDFLTAYENILRMPAENLDDFECSISGEKTSAAAEEGIVWAFSKDAGSCRTVQLINLLSRGNARWRDDDGSCENPKKLGSFTLEMEDPGSVKEVSFASPDLYGGSMLKLEYTRKDGKLQIKVPSLNYWDMLVIRTKD